MLISKGKNYWWTFIPFIFMFVTTIAALAITGYKSFTAIDFAAGAAGAIGNIIAGLLAVILIICALVLAVDGIRAIARATRKEEVGAPTGS